MHGRTPKTVLRVVSVFFMLCRNVILWTFFLSAVFDTIRPNLFYIYIAVHRGKIDNAKYFVSNLKLSLTATLWPFKTRST